MKLEVLHRKSPLSTGDKHLVLLHGACMGAWVWEDNFMPYFAEKGFDVHALSLRGHGGSEGIEKIRWFGVDGYVEDLLQEIDKLKGDVYLIGHSMGGFTIQHALDRLPEKVKGVVLLCSAPNHRLWKLVLKLIVHYPIGFLISNFKMSWKPIMMDPQKLKRIIFRPDTSDAQVAEVLSKMQEESFRVFLEMVFLNLPRPKSKRVPTMIVGAESDYLISESDTRKMARSYGITPVLISGASHSIQLEKGWEGVAEKINQFFQGN